MDNTSPPGWRFLSTLVTVGFVWRLFVNWMTDMPREDGVNYLWMAERFADGDACSALGEIFSPLLALLVAVPVACGLEPFVAGQLSLAFVGSLAVIPIVKLSESLCPGAGRCAGCLMVVATRPVMLGAEIYTEPMFLLVGCYAFLFGVRERYWLCGVFTGLAFWIRPEAALIPVAFLVVTRRAWVALIPMLAAVALLAAWRGACGHGHDPVPKLAFIMAHNVAGETDAVGFVLRSLGHLVQIPWLFVEAWGVLALLAVYGAIRLRPKANLWLLLFAVLVICAYVPRWRFLVNWMFVVAPIAAVGLTRLPGHAWWLAGILVFNMAMTLQGGVAANRIAERRVAEFLRQQLRPGEVITGDMTRVRYFAGFRPLEPRHFTAAELIAAGRDARFVVLRRNRDTTPLVRDGLTAHREMVLPGEFARLADDRRMLVLER